MSRDEKVNWLQFAEERREYRKRIKKRKALPFRKQSPLSWGRNAAL
jgi:hypothetical protein